MKIDLVKNLKFIKDLNNLEALILYRQRLLSWRGGIDPKFLRKELTQVREDISHYKKLKNDRRRF